MTLAPPSRVVKRNDAVERLRACVTRVKKKTVGQADRRTSPPAFVNDAGNVQLWASGGRNEMEHSGGSLASGEASDSDSIVDTRSPEGSSASMSAMNTARFSRSNARERLHRIA